jgi:hypothetical protein
MLHCHKIGKYCEILTSCSHDADYFQAHFAGGQQIVLMEGAESMAPLPDYVKNLVHAEFVPLMRYGPLD